MVRKRYDKKEEKKPAAATTTTTPHVESKERETERERKLYTKYASWPKTFSALTIKADPSDFINALKRFCRYVRKDVNSSECVSALCVCVCVNALNFAALVLRRHTPKVKLPQTKNICTNRTCFFSLSSHLRY